MEESYLGKNTSRYLWMQATKAGGERGNQKVEPEGSSLKCFPVWKEIQFSTDGLLATDSYSSFNHDAAFALLNEFANPLQ